MATHEFRPTQYHNTLGWHDPVLEIDPGDTVLTTTVDARGQDHEGQRVTQRGNPQTGPFYVRGAELGDALVVTLDELIPSRSWGFTACQVAPNVLDPGYWPTFEDDLSACPTFDGAPFFRWAVDVAAGTAHLAEPEGALSKLKLPLDPMVGCFGVAPAGGQAISTATSSTHGGNMDYRGFRQGTKVYFPVFAPGALFHIGDGHAVQGDGEIVGTGIEVPFDVRFTVDLVKDSSVSWPRAVDATWLMAVGNARPLDQCVQHATTEMLTWLQRDFGLDARTAHQLLGQAVSYDVGNIFDPAYTMVCKVRRDHVEALR
jgi:acetamidase/formamidase